MPRVTPAPTTFVGANDRYRLVRPLAGDVLGELWQGKDVAHHATVTIRLLPGSDDHDRVEELHGQLDQVAAKLRHANVAVILDHGDGEPGPAQFVVMERLRGVSLARRLSATVGLRPEAAVTIGAAIAEGLEAAHSAGVAHRVLTADSVLLDPDGPVKIIDFGVAAILADAPPLLHQGQAEDVHALGGLLRASLASCPRQAGPVDHLARNVLGREGAAVWKATLDQDPLARPHVSDLARALRSSAEAPAAATRPPRSPAHDPRTALWKMTGVGRPRGAGVPVGSKSPAPGRKPSGASEPRVRDPAHDGRRAVAVAGRASGVPARPSARSWRWLAPAAAVAIVVAFVLPSLQGEPPSAPPSRERSPADTTPQVIVMPDLRGLSLSEARSVLGRSDLVLANRVEAAGDPGTVVATDPGLGQVVRPGGAVTIYVGADTRGARTDSG